MVKQYSTITSGTITANDTKQNVQVIHDAASLAATLTATLPASPIDGQTFGFASVLGVTVLTMSSALTIIGALTTIAAAGFSTWTFNSDSSKWIRTA